LSLPFLPFFSDTWYFFVSLLKMPLASLFVPSLPMTILDNLTGSCPLNQAAFASRLLRPRSTSCLPLDCFRPCPPLAPHTLPSLSHYRFSPCSSTSSPLCFSLECLSSCPLDDDPPDYASFRIIIILDKLYYNNYSKLVKTFLRLRRKNPKARQGKGGKGR